MTARQDESGGAKPIAATPYQWAEPAQIPVRRWLYGRHLIRKFVSGTVATGAVGKSSLIIGECLAMASGQPLLGSKVESPLRVWLWNLEDPQEELQRRIQAAAMQHNLLPADLDGRLFVDSGRDQPCTIAEAVGGRTIVTPMVEEIIAEILWRQIDVLTVDPFISCHRVPENDNGAVDMVAKLWGQVADRTNCAVELVHHTRKTSEGTEATVDSSRGAKAMTDACRSVRVLNRMTKDEGDRAGVDNHKLFFRLIDDKANLAPPADKSDWFRLANVDLGNAPDGAGDRIGVVVTWQYPDAFAGVTASNLLDVQRAIDGKNYRESVQAADWAGYAVAEVLGLDMGNRGEKAKVKSLLKTWIETGALKVEDVPDEKRKPRPTVLVGAWAI